LIFGAISKSQTDICKTKAKNIIRKNANLYDWNKKLTKVAADFI
jgi:hypothetical protein